MRSFLRRAPALLVALLPLCLFIGSVLGQQVTTTAGLPSLGSTNTWTSAQTFSPPILFVGAAPTIVASSCGTGSPVVATGSNVIRGTVTEGTLSSGCQLTFPGTFPSAPSCVVGGLTAFTIGGSAAIAAGVVTLTVVNASLSGSSFSYVCFW